MPSNVTITLYVGAGEEALKVEQKLKKAAANAKKSFSEWAIEILTKAAEK